jgi:hypothetical protein
VNPVPQSSGYLYLWADANYGGCELIINPFPSGACANMDENTNDEITSFQYDPNAFQNCIVWQ